MTNETELQSMSLDERQRVRKQMSDQAVKLAVNSRWAEAANANKDFIKLFGGDAESYNRLGKAQTELGQISEARKSYGRAIEMDATNTIARRNLDRLAAMKDSGAAAAAPSQLDTRLFVEETGTGTIAKLQAVDPAHSALLDAGDLVELKPQGNAVNVHVVSGEYVGMVEPRIGLRLSKMMASGNQYTAAMVTATNGDLKLMIRETFQHPSMIGKVSFPQARATDAPRAYTRKGLLRKEMGDIEYGDDDVEDEAEDGWSETGDDMDSHTPEVDADSDDESFD
jgi:tetratricopeptide (TPR) repeat protein